MRRALPFLAVAALVLAATSAQAGRPSFTFQAAAPGSVEAGSPALVLRVRTSLPAQVTATLYRSGQKHATWQRSVPRGSTRVRLALAPRSRVPGRYALLLRARAGSETIFRTLRYRIGAT